MTPFAPIEIITLLAFVGTSAGFIAHAVVSSKKRQKLLQETHRRQLLDLHGTVAQLREELETLRRSNREKEGMTRFFVTSLPELIRQINRNRDKRHIAPLLLRMVELIFEPVQIGIFYRSPAGDSFKLAASKGLPPEMHNRPLEVGLAGGSIDWVSTHQVVMAAQDFVFASCFEAGPPDAPAPLVLDLCAPMVDPDTQQTVGVISVGQAAKSAQHGKTLLKMVADLGTLGLKSIEYHRSLRTLANQDGLTGLYNKRFGMDQLSLAIHRAEKRGADLSVFVFDIDHFKTYNDTHGHLPGDEVLRQIGHILQNNIRTDDFSVRFGGEEFLVVFQDTAKQGAVWAAEKIRQKVESHPFAGAASQPGGRLTISGGVATLRTDSHTSTELIRLADKALYAAKAAGRNRVLAHRASYLCGDTEPEPEAEPVVPTRTDHEDSDPPLEPSPATSSHPRVTP